MPGKATVALAVEQSTGAPSPQKPVRLVLKKIMDIPPPNLLEEGDDDIEKEKLCIEEEEAAVVVGSGGAVLDGEGVVPGVTASGGGVGGGSSGGGGGNVSASLTPAIWERTIPYDGETFHLEYMDLDEFLLENGIPVTVDDHETKAAPVPTVATVVGPGDDDDNINNNDHKGKMTESTDDAHDITAVGTPSADAVECATASTSSPSPDALSLVSSEPEEPRTVTTLLPAKLEEEEEEEEEDEEEEEKEEEEEDERGDEEEDQEEEEEEEDDKASLAEEEVPMKVVTKKIKTERKVAGRDTPSPVDPDAIEVDVNFQPDPTDLVLSSVPGGELFNPRKHKFSDEELKPQPMIKKAKKVYVPDEQKDDKYWSRRKKNNMAAKRSRDARRLKENQITVRASFLERENAALRQQVAELRKDCSRCRSSVARYEAKYGPL